MKFIDSQIEEEIFNALMSRQTKFKIRCIEFQERLITGTVKQRERKCRAKAKELAMLVEDC